MTRRFRLASVLRARQAQEKVAKAAVVRARAAAAASSERRAERERALTARPTVDGGPAAWYIAALAARQALAGELSAADRRTEEAAEQVTERITELTDAAIRRRSMETLADRHAAAAQHAELAASQRVLDEVAGATRRPTGRIEQ
jgi:flagellar biosynthesis chaperone FliJ